MGKVLKIIKGDYMKIENASFNLVYPKISDIRRKFISFEDKLEKYFAPPFQILPVPDDAPEDIPRIIANSNNGHTQLNIGLMNAQFTTNFSLNYCQNLDQCMDYLEERINYLLEVFAEVNGDNFLFAGLTVRVLFDASIIKEDPIDVLNEKVLRLRSTNKPFDIASRVTYILDDKYYVNVELSNTRVYENFTAQPLSSLYGLKQIDHNISLVIDINDRYGYNYVHDYRTNPESVKNILKTSRDFLKKKSYNVIREGVFEL